MKKYLLILFLPVSLIAQTIMGPGPYYTGVQITSVANTNSSSNSNSPASATNLTGIVPIANGGTGTNTARAASTSIGVAQMSAATGGSYFNDMTNFADQFSGQLGLAMDGPTTGQAALYSSFGTSGTGTNVWSQMPFGFPQGIRSIGNGNFAGDLPSLINQNTAAGQSLTVFQQWGHRASTLAAAYGYGNTNIVSAVQPAFIIANGSPWSGAAQVQVKAAFTNSIHGVLVGTNDDGMAIYSPQYGPALYQIGDAYRVGERNQTPSQGILMNDDNLVWYFSGNSGRPGDPQSGQIPYLAINPKNTQINSSVLFEIPKQVTNVWMDTNANWKNTLLADEGTGNVLITNGALALGGSSFTGGIVTNPIGSYYVAGGVFKWNAHSGQDDSSTPFNIDSSASFNNEDSALTVDASGSQRLAIMKHNGQFPMFVMASGSPMQFAHSSASALQTSIGTQTLTVDMSINGSGVVVTNSENLAVQGKVYGNGFVSSLSNLVAPTSISFPATTVNWTNTTGFNIEVYVNNATVTGTAIKKNGTTIFTSVTGDATIGLQPNETFSETYTVGSPTATYSPL